MTPTDFKLMFPEFAAEADNRVQLFLDQATAKLDQGRWEDLFDEGVAYLAAHELKVTTVSGASAAADTKVMKKVGSIQTQNSEQAILKKMENPYLSTVYGQKFNYYRKLIGLGGVSA